MQKKVFKITVGVALLIVAGSVVFAWNGPCITISSNCGGYGGGMGSCKPNLEDGVCEGRCTSYCPSGPKDQYCKGLAGYCVTATIICSRIIKYRCVNVGAGVPSCTCIEQGLGGNCWRQVCD